METRRIATLFGVCAFALGALFVDLVLLPVQSRESMPDNLYGFMFACFFLSALFISLRFKQWQDLALTSCALTAVLFFLPIYLALQGVDTSAIVVRRLWVGVFLWMLTLATINMQRKWECTDRSKRELAQTLSELESSYVAQKQVLHILTDSARRTQTRLDQAQRLAKLGSWEQNLGSGTLMKLSNSDSLMQSARNAFWKSNITLRTTKTAVPR
jgi:hypothetical protein